MLYYSLKRGDKVLHVARHFSEPPSECPGDKAVDLVGTRIVPERHVKKEKTGLGPALKEV